MGGHRNHPGEREPIGGRMERPPACPPHSRSAPTIPLIQVTEIQVTQIQVTQIQVTQIKVTPILAIPILKPLGRESRSARECSHLVLRGARAGTVRERRSSRPRESAQCDPEIRR